MRGTRRPGPFGDQGREHRIRTQLLVDRDRIGVQIEHPAAPADGDGQVTQVGEGEAARDVVGFRGEGGDAMSVREAQGPAVGTVAPFLHAGYGGGGEVAEEVVGVERGPEGEAEVQGGRGAREPTCAARTRIGACPLGACLREAVTELARGEGEDLADGVVEGTDRGETGGEGDLRHGQRGRLDEEPRGLGALSAGEGERAGAQFGVELPFDLAGAVAEAGGEAGDTLAVHDPVADQPHRAGHEVGALVPLG